MSVAIAIHETQTVILRELLFRPSAGYAELQKPTKLASDHFNFHITRLVELGLVERISRGQYKLSLAGKEYANKLDTANNTIERQPKIAVMLAISRIIHGQTQYLIQERIKNPNYGFFGFPTGKVKWGETIIEAAIRECYEETGLQASFQVKGTYHEHVRLDESNELAEDKIFFMCEGSDVQGELQTVFEGGKNHWLTLEELAAKDRTFKSLDFEKAILTTDEWLLEKTLTYPSSTF